jgi:hypothetical protein
MLVEDDSACSFNDKHGLIVDQAGVAALSEPIILPYRMIQQRSADLLRRLAVVLTHDHFQQLTIVFVAAVVNSIGVKDQNISRTHQRNLEIGRVELCLPEVQGVVPPFDPDDLQASANRAQGIAPFGFH